MAAPSLAPGLQRKLRKVCVTPFCVCSVRCECCSSLQNSHLLNHSQVLDTRSEAPEMAASLATLSTFYADNTP